MQQNGYFILTFIIFQDTVITAAIIDRILHHCNTVKIIGESYRLKESKALFMKKKE